MKKDSSGVALILLASVGYDRSRAAQYLLSPHLVFQSNWGWGNLGFFQLLQSNSSPEGVWNLSGCIELHMKITESNCWVLLDPGGGKTVLWYTWGYVVQVEFHPGTSWHLDGSGVERHLVVGKSFHPHTAFGWQVKIDVWSISRYSALVTVPSKKNGPIKPRDDKPHHTVNRGKFTCFSRWMCGFSVDQYTQLWRFTVPFSLNCASSDHTTFPANASSSRIMLPNHSQYSSHRSMSSSFIACNSLGIYTFHFALFKIRFTLDWLTPV